MVEDILSKSLKELKNIKNIKVLDGGGILEFILHGEKYASYLHFPNSQIYILSNMLQNKQDFIEYQTLLLKTDDIIINYPLLTIPKIAELKSCIKISKLLLKEENDTLVRILIGMKSKRKKTAAKEDSDSENDGAIIGDDDYNEELEEEEDEIEEEEEEVINEEEEIEELNEEDESEEE